MTIFPFTGPIGVARCLVLQEINIFYKDNVTGMHFR